MQNGIFLFLIKNKVSKKRSILDPLQDQKKLADPDPITCDPGSRVHDPDPEAVIPDPIYLVTTLISSWRTRSVYSGKILCPTSRSLVIFPAKLNRFFSFTPSPRSRYRWFMKKYSPHSFSFFHPTRWPCFLMTCVEVEFRLVILSSRSPGRDKHGF